jgi:hypothetical protein
LAFLSTAVATALRIAIDPYVEGFQYIIFVPAVMITTLISGFGAGLFCIVRSRLRSRSSSYLLPAVANPARGCLMKRFRSPGGELIDYRNGSC